MNLNDLKGREPRSSGDTSRVFSLRNRRYVYWGGVLEKLFIVMSTVFFAQIGYDVNRFFEQGSLARIELTLIIAGIVINLMVVLCLGFVMERIVRKLEA